MVAAISDPGYTTARARGHGASSNIMLSLQHDTGKWCTEYTWSAEDGMWGVRTLHNFGKLWTPATDATEHSDKSTSTKPKRVDEEEAMEGGLKGRISAGAEFYISAKEKSDGGMSSKSL